MIRIHLMVLCLVAAGCGDGGPAATNVPPDEPGPAMDTDAPVHGVAEVTLRADETFDAESGTPNPFTDVDLTAEVTGPDGRTRTVDGFFDGDGEGGETGSVFSFRIACDAEGSWSWRTESDLASLDGQTGTVTCEGARTDVFAEGPLEIGTGEASHAFRRRDGRPLFLVGKFLAHDQVGPTRYSHVMFSERLDDGDREDVLAYQRDRVGANKINVYLANRGDYGGSRPTTPWVGDADSPDRSRFDLDRWRMYERWVARMAEEGILAHLWVFADDSDFGDLPVGERRLLYRYAMARLSPFVNVVVTPMLEWDEGWSPQAALADAAILQDHNPWDRLVGMHGRPGDVAFTDHPDVDFLQLQSGFVDDAEHHRNAAVRNRSRTGKPLIAEEFTWGKETETNRIRTWAVVTAAPAGIGTGAYLVQLGAFLERVPMHRLRPADAIVREGAAWAAEEAGARWLLYLPDGGTVTFDPGVAGTLETVWFDPREGTFGETATSSGTGARTLTAPDDRDWAVYVRLPGSD